MLYHLQYKGPSGWEALGSGYGSGPDAVAGVVAELQGLAGGSLPHGEYRCIKASGEGSWLHFELTGERLRQVSPL